MKKILIIISFLSILGTNANACHGDVFNSSQYSGTANKWQTYGKATWLEKEFY